MMETSTALSSGNGFWPLSTISNTQCRFWAGGPHPVTPRFPFGFSLSAHPFPPRVRTFERGTLNLGPVPDKQGRLSMKWRRARARFFVPEEGFLSVTSR